MSKTKVIDIEVENLKSGLEEVRKAKRIKEFEIVYDDIKSRTTMADLLPYNEKLFELLFQAVMEEVGADDIIANAEVSWRGEDSVWRGEDSVKIGVKAKLKKGKAKIKPLYRSRFIWKCIKRLRKERGYKWLAKALAFAVFHPKGRLFPKDLVYKKTWESLPAEPWLTNDNITKRLLELSYEYLKETKNA